VSAVRQQTDVLRQALEERDNQLASMQRQVTQMQAEKEQADQLSLVLQTLCEGRLQPECQGLTDTLEVG